MSYAVYLAIGVTLEALGLWLARSEGAKFWLQIITELKNRGVENNLIAYMDGLKGFPEAVAAIFPRPRSNSASSK